MGLKIDTLSSKDRLPRGKVNLRCEFTADKNGQMATGGRSSLFVNDKQVAEGRLERGARCLHCLRRDGHRTGQRRAGVSLVP